MTRGDFAQPLPTGGYLFRGGTDYFEAGLCNALLKLVDIYDELFDGIYSRWLQLPQAYTAAINRIYSETGDAIFRVDFSFAPDPVPGVPVSLPFDNAAQPEGAPITTVAGAPGLSIRGAVQAHPGAPVAAFGDDDGGSGDTLTADDDAAGIVQFVFAAPVQGLKVDIVDDLSPAYPPDRIQLRVYDAESGGRRLETIEYFLGQRGYVPDPQLTTNANHADFSFGFAGVDRIRGIEIQGPARSDIPGYGIDNLRFIVAGNGGGGGDPAAPTQQVPMHPAFIALGAGLLGALGYRTLWRSQPG